MKKSGKQRAASRKNKQPSKSIYTASTEGRRSFMQKFGIWGIVAAAVGGIGAYTAVSISTAMEDSDLTKIKNGTPTIVQIHDPNCRICTALQSETKDALTKFDDKIDYAVANIRSNEGREFAAKYGVPHITLLLFDKRGRLKSTLQGMRQSEELEIAFSVLLPTK